MTDYLTQKIILQHRLEGLANGLSDEIDEIFDGGLESVAGKILLLGSKAEETESLTKRKKILDSQRANIEGVLAGLFLGIKALIKDKTFEVAKGAPKIAHRMMSEVVVNVNFDYRPLHKQRINGWFRTRQVEGLFFNQWISKLEKNASARIITEAQRSLIFGGNLKTNTQRLQNSLNISKKSADMLARTYLNAAYNWGEMQYFLENQDKIKRVKFVAVLDRKVTPQCASLDSKVFKLLESPQPPLHPKCRSILVPHGEVFEGTRTARIHTQKHVVHHRAGGTTTTYKKFRKQNVPQSMSYTEWMQSMINSKSPADRNFVKESLGPTRYKLLASGKIKMNSIYYRGRLRSIKQLQELMK